MIENEDWIAVNKKHHDKFAVDYAEKHLEIYNETEQERLAAVLGEIIATLKCNVENPHAFDFGAGAGNLTSHMLTQGCKVTAADISEGCLEHVELIFKNSGMLSTSILNGKDVSQFGDETFDLCATYSVLHHVPDYLFAVRELARITKKGGIVFIDHESSPQSWVPSEDRDAYYKEISVLTRETFWQKWGPKGLLHRMVWKWHKIDNPRYQPEGDIHIWSDDHIEWDKIVNVLKDEGFSQIDRTDYLVCRERGGCTPVYDRYRDKYKDMSMIIARKL